METKKLTTEQITAIEETLVLNGLIYDDIKLELTDHIASEIEVAMNDNSISFEAAMLQTFENWKDQLRPSSSFWLGRKNIAPKIVIEKWELIHRKQNPAIIQFAFFITIIIGVLKAVNTENIPENISLVARWFCLALWVFIATIRIIIWKSKHKTLFGFIFKKRSRVPLNFLVLIALGLFPSRMLEINSILGITVVFMIILVILFSFSCLTLAYKHFQFEKKLSISKI
jgi:hypothetical protein